MRVLFLVLAVLVLLVIGSLVEAADPDPSLVLYLPFDSVDGDIVEDLSKHGHVGTINGDPELVDGKFDKALKFDGVDDWVQVPHAEILTVDEEVTVMAWINTERHSGPGGVNWQGILAKSNSTRSYSFYTRINGVLHFSTAGVGSSSAAQIPLNEWVHVAAVVKDGGHIYYVNGEPGGQGGGGVKLPGLSDTDDVLVGKTHEGSREFLGMIDEVRIWDRALELDEVKAEMDKGADSLPVEPASKLTTTWGSIKE